MKRFLLVFTAMAFLLANTTVMAETKSEKELRTTEKIEFTDISNHWAKDVIVKMSDKGLIKGFGNGKFLPDENMRRSEFAAVLHKILDIELNYIKAPDINEFFDDVKKDEWFASQLYDLASLNIIDDREKFRPDDKITREEMVNYLINGYNYKSGMTIYEFDESTDFSDDEDIDIRYKNAVKKATKLGFIRGREKNVFAPKGKATRAEALVVLEKLLDNLEKIKNELKEDKQKQVVVETDYEKSDKSFKMKLKITNNTNKNITINHTSGQKFDFKLLDENKEILYTWSMDKMFIAALTDTIIEAGKSIEFSDELDMENFGNIVNKAKYLQAFIVGTSEDFKIDDRGYEKEIKEEPVEKEKQVVVETDYEKNEKVFRMKLKITNNTDKSITIQTSGQKYDFKLLDEKKNVLYIWSADKIFIMMLMDMVIEAGESVEFIEELDMESFGDIVNKAKYLQGFIVGTSEDFKIDDRGYEKEIKKGSDEKEKQVVVETDYEKSDKSFKMKLKITNNTDKSITIQTSGQKYDFKLLDEKKNVLYTWSADKIFIMMLMDMVIEAGESVEFIEELDMESFGDIVNKAKYLQGFIAGTSEDFKIDDRGYEKEIKKGSDEKEKQVFVETDYEKGDKSFKMKLKITNNTDKNITIQTSGQKYDFKLLDGNKKVLYTWSADRAFIEILMNTVIEAGKSVEFTEELDMASFKDIVNKAKYLQGFITGTSEDFKINKDGYEKEIK
ncbi:BsuPI-related putative proteinase inhibitor [Acetivibrio clariflavus]|uniref:BsuPI-related putative proteinase inhibitor n=1 Tax=Acetivibrio clariflavus TaxID=288965 RepID=UPI00048356E1|nr:BsuPI-related putative proteinase inhibitor [Acetivibrio clariflavus]